MINLGKVILLYLLLFIFAVLACMWLTSCNPAKRIERQQENFDRIGRKWLDLHPCANDSVSVYLPGEQRTDTITTTSKVVTTDTTTLHDTITNTITRVITRSLHDTVKISVIDRSLIKLLQADKDSLRSQVANLSVQLEKYKGKAAQRLWVMISLMLLVLLLTYLLIRKIFKI